MSDQHFSDIDTSLEPLSLSQALRRVSEAEPYISDFNLWRFGVFKKDRENVISLAMASLATNEGSILPILPMLRSGYSLDFFHRDNQSKNRLFEINADSHTVNVVTENHRISHQTNLLDDLRSKQPNFKLISGMYFHQTKIHGCMGGYITLPTGLQKSNLFVFNNRNEPVEVEWDIVIDEANKEVSIQCVRPKKYPRLDKYPLLKETLLAGFAYNRNLSLQLVLRNGGSSLEFWLKGVLHSFEEIINNSKNF